MYRLEVWPFGPGPWTVAITYPPAPTAVPTLAPVTVNTTAPITVVPSENLTTAAETSVPPTPTPTETPTATPTEASAPMPTQAPRTFTGNGNAKTPVFTLNQGLASFTSSTTANGTFSVTLVGSGETATGRPDGRTALEFEDGPDPGDRVVSPQRDGERALGGLDRLTRSARPPGAERVQA